jgi:hypothetical protein
MARSDYRYGIEQAAGRSVLVIEDLNLGRVSVTNDIENVLNEIGLKEWIDPREYMVIYRDSGGVWDGYDPVMDEFIPLAESTWSAAVKAYIEKQLS